MMNINNALILVTNANSVIGRTTAAHFVRLGATVLLCDEDATLLNKTLRDLFAISSQVHAFPIERCTTENINLLLKQIEDKFGRTPNVLLNCWVSAPMPSLTCDNDVDDALSVLTSTAKSLYRFGRGCAQQMQQSETKGVIVNLISCGANDDLSGIDNVISLVSGFTHSWARDLTPFHIRVGGVVPAPSYLKEQTSRKRWAEVQDELVRNAAYIVGNDYFSGRVMTANA